MWSKKYRNDRGAVEYSANAFKVACTEIGVSIPYADSFEYDIKRMAVDNNFMSTHLGDNYHMHVGTYITERYFDGEFATFKDADAGTPESSDETEERRIVIDSISSDPVSRMETTGVASSMDDLPYLSSEDEALSEDTDQLPTHPDGLVRIAASQFFGYMEDERLAKHIMITDMELRGPTLNQELYVRYTCTTKTSLLGGDFTITLPNFLRKLWAVFIHTTHERYVTAYNVLNHLLCLPKITDNPPAVMLLIMSILKLTPVDDELTIESVSQDRAYFNPYWYREIKFTVKSDDVTQHYTAVVNSAFLEAVAQVSMGLLLAGTPSKIIRSEDVIASFEKVVVGGPGDDDD
jgi:hypothetical protein